MGWASSGVEYAQLYRAQSLRKTDYDSKFIFSEFTLNNLISMSQNMGFMTDEIVSVYYYFSNIKFSEPKLSFEKVQKEYFGSFTAKDESNLVNDIDNIKVILHNNQKATATVDYADVYSNGALIRREHFTTARNAIQYFNSNGTVARREILNQDGSVALVERIDDKENIFQIDKNIFLSKDEFMMFFIQQLRLKRKDIILIDRSLGAGSSILKGNNGNAKVGIIIHAEHFNENSTDDDYILWNNHYDYPFTNAEYIDFFVTATETQKNLLSKHFDKYQNNKTVKIFDIPVGSIDKLKKNTNREPHTFVTASRLAPEKNLNWLVEAFIKAHETNAEIKLDIYGAGGEKKQLEKLIKDAEADEYIKLCGHHDLSDLYTNYSYYLTASTSEGFGLTLMEAIGSGLVFGGFDVNYGNTNFIKNNGITVPFTRNNATKNIVNLTNMIVELDNYSANQLVRSRRMSYKIADKYLEKNVTKQWIDLVKKVTE